MNVSNHFFYKKKIIITGATGFIGSHLAKKLVATGALVYAFVRKESDIWRLHTIDNLSLIHI